LPIVYQAFFPTKNSEGDLVDVKFSWAGVKEAPLACVLPLCITATLTVGLFFVPGFLLELAQIFVDSVK